MKESLRQTLVWMPRILGILFIAFTSLFALDVFTEYRGWELFLALFGHTRCDLVMLVALILAWRWPWIGALGFGLAGVWYLSILNGALTGTLVFAGVPLLIAALFLAGWIIGKSFASDKMRLS